MRGIHHVQDHGYHAEGGGPTKGSIAVFLEGTVEDGVRVATARGAHDLLCCLLEKGARLVDAGNLERWVYPQVERMALQDARAHPVDRANPGGIHHERLLAHARLAKRGADTLLDLARGGVGEGDNEDLAQVIHKGRTVHTGAGREGPGNPARKGERLAGAGASFDKDRAVKRGDDLTLTVVQGREVYA